VSTNAAAATVTASTGAGRSGPAAGSAGRPVDRAAGRAGVAGADTLRADGSSRTPADAAPGAAGQHQGNDLQAGTAAAGTGQAGAAWPAPAANAPAAAGPAAAAERALAASTAIAQTGAALAGVDTAGALQPAPVTTTAMAGAQPAAPLVGALPGSAAPTEARIPVPLDQPGFGAALGTHVSLLVQGGVQTARLQLNPAEMGPIAVQIALDGSAARVDFQADLASTRQVIEASLPALAGALQDAGFTLAGGGVFQQAPGGRQGQGDGQPQPGQPRFGSGNTTGGDPLPGPAPTLRTQRGLVDLVA
jgi:flagellar hook-length control protein FliK